MIRRENESASRCCNLNCKQTKREENKNIIPIRRIYGSSDKLTWNVWLIFLIFVSEKHKFDKSNSSRISFCGWKGRKSERSGEIIDNQSFPFSSKWIRISSMKFDSIEDDVKLLYPTKLCYLSVSPCSASTSITSSSPTSKFRSNR